ncbi:DEAD/DEAH box helicase [Heyndrickxia vini]|uniref:DEAD/DEAH box helicase n=1 Tax=Heyndrickxia vini TaxID=1476025 RepID=A0ABX7E320_9BACI|nr:AAA family ATPase [Heyndrickxia vini]QQZ09629.1 DEAD/DEAH box helicase [Heyndrickxia vini]
MEVKWFMQNTHFFSNIESDNNCIKNFIDRLDNYSNENATQVYLLSGPLGEKKYSYNFENPIVLLIPGYQIMVIDSQEIKDEFENFYDDFVEDLGHLSDRFEYKKILGRPRIWKQDLIAAKHLDDFNNNVESFLMENQLDDLNKKRQIELLISLLIGSINSIEKIGQGLPETILEKVKRNIVLFDGDQTRFIFKKINHRRVTIQGLAGTGKTELLLHKIKELYTENNTNRIAFTCFNKALANSLKNRVPNFFDFMKVEEQIKWGERLWIMHSWGSKLDNNNIGLYSYICKQYGIPFIGLKEGSFDSACKKAIEYLKQGEIESIFDYVLIDESQDFSESFFELCEMITKNTVYVAGDIFQNIFQPNTTESSPDFLLNKCYRTDPRTLMFAHAIGFGLFENKGIRRLNDDQWNACGYEIEGKGNRHVLTRTPLRKFNDLEEANIESVKMVTTEKFDCSDNVIDIIRQIKEQHTTVSPEDIAIIFTDNVNGSYDLMNLIALKISHAFQWKTNKLYDTKEMKKDFVSISNINNIKGLEFPFVICVSSSPIGHHVRKRNALYMTLTRSFITSYLIINQQNNKELIKKLQSGLESINNYNKLIFEEPVEYIDQAELALDVNDLTLSQRDIVDQIFEKHNIPMQKQDQLRQIVQTIAPDSVDRNQIEKIINTNKGLI